MEFFCLLVKKYSCILKIFPRIYPAEVNRPGLDVYNIFNAYGYQTDYIVDVHRIILRHVVCVWGGITLGK
jgi:hypothetical protein